MLDYLGWVDAADPVCEAVEETISAGNVTYDFHRQIEADEKLVTSEFADAVMQHINELA